MPKPNSNTRSGAGTPAKASGRGNRASSNFDRLFGTTEGSRSAPGLMLINLDRIETSQQPRTEFPPDQLEGLAASIRELRAKGEGIEGTGILQPLLAAPLPDAKFHLIAGERRFRAASMAGLTQIPAIVVPLRADQLLITQMIENLQRADLTPLEEAEAVGRLSSEQGLSIRAIADALGKDRGWVQNRARLGKISEDVREMVRTRQDSIPHAFEIDALTDPALRQEMIGLTLQGVSVSEIRSRIAQHNSGNTTKATEGEVSFQNDTSGRANKTQLSFQNDSGREKSLVASKRPAPDVVAALEIANAYLEDAVQMIAGSKRDPKRSEQIMDQLMKARSNLSSLREMIQ